MKDKGSNNSNNNKTFEKEERFLQEFKERLNEHSECDPEVQALLRHALTQYENLLQETKLLTNISDKLEKKARAQRFKLQEQRERIRKFNRELRRKNQELEQTIEALTKARAGRKATTYVLFLALVLFVISELIENKIDDMLQGSSWANTISWILKGFIAILFKPVESLLENYFVKRALAEEQKRKSQQKQSQRELLNEVQENKKTKTKKIKKL